MDKKPEEDWGFLKQEGNTMFGKGIFDEAIMNYTAAIVLLEKIVILEKAEILEKVDENNQLELSKIYSNRSMAFCQLYQKQAEKKKDLDVMDQALTDGLKAVEFDPSFEKAHFRCATALHCLDRDAEAAKHITHVLEIYKGKGKHYSTDSHVQKLIKDCRYFANEKEESPNWEKVKYQDNCKVIDWAGAGDYCNLTPDLIKGESEISLLVCPGKYRLENLIAIADNQDVQIIGFYKSTSEEVVLEKKATRWDANASHIFIVIGGKLTLTGVGLRQTSDHPEVHAVYAISGSHVELIDSRFYSKCSGCIAVAGGSYLHMNNCQIEDACGGVIIVSGSQGLIEKCDIKKCACIGVEVREQGFATVNDCNISESGAQAVVCHADGLGFAIERCVLSRNSLKFGERETAVNVGAGLCLVADCQLLNNRGGGLMVQDGGYCVVRDTTISGGRNGVACSMKGEATVKRCTLTNNKFGLCIIFNQEGRVVLEDNTIEAKLADIVVSKDDYTPIMIGKQHKVMGEPKVMAEDASRKSMKRQLKAGIRKKQADKFSYLKWWDDRRENTAEDERLCSPCGLTQATKGVRYRMCSNCRITWYCSKECQSKDWDLHKPMCQKIKEILTSG